MLVLETPRLLLRRFTLDDAAFILRLVNDPSWLRFIGDKNVHNLDGARRYLREGPLDMYQRHGFGMYPKETTSTGWFDAFYKWIVMNGFTKPGA